VGGQRLVKSGVEEDVLMVVVNVRLREVGTDLLITCNLPSHYTPQTLYQDLVDPTSSSYYPPLEVFLRSFKVEEWNLFA